MPTRNDRREREILEIFLNGYESGRWADAKYDWVDERFDSSVEVIATNRAGQTLAIEHTLVEIFVGDKEDAERHKGFLALRDDPELVVFGKMIVVQIPRNTLTRGFDWQPVVREFREWLRSMIASFPADHSEQVCPVSEVRIANKQIPVKVRVLDMPQKPGRLFISRYGYADTAESVDRALHRKLPKLTKTVAQRRILMFERNQMTQIEGRMFEIVEMLKDKYPDISLVHEFWCVETIGYEEDKPRDERVLFFSRFSGIERVETLMFNAGHYSE